MRGKLVPLRVGREHEDFRLKKEDWIGLDPGVMAQWRALRDKVLCQTYWRTSMTISDCAYVFELSLEEVVAILERDWMMEEDRMMKWFAFEHLPGHLQPTSQQFHVLALWVVNNVMAGPERTTALRKLLEAKDAAVRAVVKPGG